MESPGEKDMGPFIDALERFLKGDSAARVGEVAEGEGLEALRTKLNEVLDRAAIDNETFHKINMGMANALTDWFEVLSEMKAGNLDARVTAHYGDEFLDKLGNQLNDTLSAMKAAEEERALSNRRKSEALRDWFDTIREVTTVRLFSVEASVTPFL